MISFILIAIASISDAIMDVLRNHFDKSVFRHLKWAYWNPEMSWENKWKRGRPENGERFFGSSTIFVWLTDAWHLFKAIMWVCLIAAIILYKPIFGIYDAIIILVVRGIFFEIVYRVAKD